jgi:hypothetical protein
MTDREITFEWLTGTATGNALSGIIDAIDLASDQDGTTWITSGGKRIAKIAPVDEIPENILSKIPPATDGIRREYYDGDIHAARAAAAMAAWARSAGISATEFMALPASQRRAILGQSCERISGDPS